MLGDLQQQWGLPAEALGYVTSAVQLGFIAGTLAFALLAISDVFSPRLVFFFCALLGALCNAALAFAGEGLAPLLAWRFAAGFFLAGIYPVGMKIAAGWFRHDLGHALGLLVGALVLGTAFPHLAKGLGQSLPWEAVLLAVSGLSVLGGLVMLVCVPDGPYLAKGARLDPRALAEVFRVPGFRAASLGYFGHMWELYAFWAFVPPLVAAHAARSGEPLNASLWAFAVIAAGFLGCAGGGLVSLRKGSAAVAAAQLGASGACCLLSPLAFLAPTPAFLAFLLFWGVVVVGDSPQFSALNAKHAPRERMGSALTIANCIGFAITIASIQLLNTLAASVPVAWLPWLLAPGPVLGLLGLMPLLRPGAAGSGPRAP